MKLKVGEHFLNQNDEEWVVSQAFDWPDYVDYTLHRVADGEIGFLREKKAVSDDQREESSAPKSLNT